MRRTSSSCQPSIPSRPWCAPQKAMKWLTMIGFRYPSPPHPPVPGPLAAFQAHSRRANTWTPLDAHVNPGTMVRGERICMSLPDHEWKASSGLSISNRIGIASLCSHQVSGTQAVAVAPWHDQPWLQIPPCTNSCYPWDQNTVQWSRLGNCTSALICSSTCTPTCAHVCSLGHSHVHLYVHLFAHMFIFTCSFLSLYIYIIYRLISEHVHT